MENIALIAHDKLKKDLVDFILERKEWIDGVNLLATGRTAEYIEPHIPNVKHLSQGRYGGYKELTNLIKEGKIDIVIFLRDFKVKYHHNDLQELLDACDEYNVPVATNPATAEMLILGHFQIQSIKRNLKKSQIL